MAVSAILQGTMPKESEVPPIVSEFFLAWEFGWMPDKIQKLPWQTVDMYTTLLGTAYKVMAQGKDIRSRAIAMALSQR